LPSEASGTSGNDHESRTAALWALPHLFNFRERGSFCFDLSTFGSPLRNLVDRGDENTLRRNSGGSEDRQRRASQDRCGKSDSGPGALSYLDKARLRIHGGKFRACDGGEKNLSGPPP